MSASPEPAAAWIRHEDFLVEQAAGGPRDPHLGAVLLRRGDQLIAAVVGQRALAGGRRCGRSALRSGARRGRSIHRLPPAGSGRWSPASARRAPCF